MLKLAERFFEWAIKRAAVMMCEVAARRDERLQPAPIETRKRR
jgi:hypothetical protein